jgi:hypothetical protein
MPIWDYTDRSLLSLHFSLFAEAFMKTWYSKEYPSPIGTPSKQLDDAFRELCLAQGGRPNGAAVFSFHDLQTNALTFFLSPEAGTLAGSIGAVPCKKPTPLPRFALSIGDGKSWEIHFPTFERTKPQTSSHSTPVPAQRRR